MFAPDALYARLKNGRFIIAGPCVLESLELGLETAHAVREAAAAHDLFVVFKSSYDKANRTSGSSFRGPGLAKGLEWLALIREKTGLPVITDIHEPDQAAPVAAAVDILQIPAFLCRQTSLLEAAGRTGRVVNIKKGQYVSPRDMGPALGKVAQTGNPRVLLTERGTFFGYNNLVVDMRAIPIMRKFGAPVVFDATHSVQLPGGQGESSSGEREFVAPLALAAVAAGADGVFLECHPNPDKALCDGPNSLFLTDLPYLFKKLAGLWRMSDADKN